MQVQENQSFLGLPSAPTEAVIALSIVLLAVEVVRKQGGEVTLSERLPWLIAFGFGLVHGLGFAGALAEIGLPQHEIPLALLFFNLGVELGQLLFVLVVALAGLALRRLPLAVGPRLAVAPTYAIGALASFWVFERIAGF